MAKREREDQGSAGGGAGQGLDAGGGGPYNLAGLTWWVDEGTI